MKFRKEDYVVYGSSGVYQIVDIVKEEFGGEKEREYYVLKPLYGNDMDVYIPTDNDKIQIRGILPKKDIDKIIKSIPNISDEWIEDYKDRKTEFSDMLTSGDHKKIIELIKIIYSRKGELKEDGKQLNRADSEMLKAAENLVYYEFAASLGIEPEKVIDYITEVIEGK